MVEQKMRETIGIRFSRDMLDKNKRLSNEEMEDTSTVIRKLVARGYSNFMKDKSCELYKMGTITISEAAGRAGLSVWEMEQYLVQKGYTSSYSIEDLDQERLLLK